MICAADRFDNPGSVDPSPDAIVKTMFRMVPTTLSSVSAERCLSAPSDGHSDDDRSRRSDRRLANLLRDMDLNV